jgi:uncharacterized protein (DUF924 family)
MDWHEVIEFWFSETTPQQWFAKSDEFDALIRRRFLDVYHRIMQGETTGWRREPQGRLAEILVLDQFTRNMFRDTPQAFSGDALALRLAQEAVEAGDDTKLPPVMRRFLYMPYMHSESKTVHKKAFWLFLWLFDWNTLRYELAHKRIISRFGRYPHRNRALGRGNTPEEEKFIATHKGF